MSQQIDYNFAAHKAAKLEKEQKYCEAERVWLIAEDLATNYWNKVWCVHRAEYCAKRTLS